MTSNNIHSDLSEDALWALLERHARWQAGRVKVSLSVDGCRPRKLRRPFSVRRLTQ